MTKSAYKAEYLPRVYELARQGSTDKQIAKACGISAVGFLRWKAAHPELVGMLQAARNRQAQNKLVLNNDPKAPYTFREYVYDRLPPDLKELWDSLHAPDEDRTTRSQAEATLERGGVTLKKNLFLYALVASGFNASRACARLNLPNKVYKDWIVNDPDFQAMVLEIHEHKKNFFEEALVDLVRVREPSVVIFANKTFNKDRGYNEKVDVNMTGTLGVSTTPLPLEALDLPIETRRALLAALRKAQTPNVDEDGDERELPGGTT